jgi:hypothetical protein
MRIWITGHTAIITTVLQVNYWRPSTCMRIMKRTVADTKTARTSLPSKGGWFEVNCAYITFNNAQLPNDWSVTVSELREID